jgi:hypothetical protein
VRPLFENVTELQDGADVLRRRTHGVIEVAQGRLRRVVLRPFPKLISVPEILLLGGWCHAHRPGDRCWLYYDQPRRFRNFLVLKYLVSAKGASYKTVLRAMETLDEIAYLKRSDALLCDLANFRITAPMMARHGWVPHCPSWWHRHYIKRFYGEYPGRIGGQGEASAEGHVEGVFAANTIGAPRSPGAELAPHPR